MSYTVTLPSGAKVTVCPPADARWAYRVEIDQHLRKRGNSLGALVVSRDYPPSTEEANRVKTRNRYRAKHKVRQYNRVS